MKHLTLFLTLLVLPFTLAMADDMEARSAFSTAPGRDVAAALKRAATENKRVLVIVTDPMKKQGIHVKGTMGTEEAKKLVKDNFLVVVTEFREKHVTGMLDDVSPVHPGYVLFKADGTVLAKGDFAMGAANGLKLVQDWVAHP